METQKPTIVTKKQFADFILSQPDDREFNMRGNFTDSKCGCLMVQYGAENNFGEYDGCGFNVWEDKDVVICEFDSSVSTVNEFLPKNIPKPTTYGEIKDHVRSLIK